jgi:hypothetical protein
MSKQYFCSECLQPCDGVERDFGIGAYEFWGAAGSNHNWQEVSECCDGDLLEELPEEEE